MRKFIVTSILTTGLVATSYAAATADLLQVVQQAYSGDQTFQSARATYLAATETYPQALALLLPNIGLTGSVTTERNETLEGFQGIPGSSDDLSGYQYNLTATQPVINFNNWWGLSSASYQVKQAAATYAAAAQDLLFRTAQAYLNVLLAQDTLRFNIAEKLATERQLDQAKQRFQVGLDAITSVYNAQASYDANVAQVIAAENNVQNTKEQLRRITGVYYQNLATLKKQMPLLTPVPNNVETWVYKSEQYNFTLQAARFGADAAREDIKVAFAGHLPTIDAVGSSQRIRLGDPETQISAEDTRVNSASLQLNLPIFQGGLVNSQVRQAQYNYQNAIAQMEDTHQQVSTDLRQTYNSIISGISLVKADKQAVISQQASVDSTEAALKVGTRTIVDLLNAQQELFQAQTTLAQDQYAYINNTLLFKQLAGTLTYKDLVAINSWLANQGSIKSPYSNKENTDQLTVTTKSSKPINTEKLSVLCPVPAPFSNDPKNRAAAPNKPYQKPIQSASSTKFVTSKTYSIQIAARQNKADLIQFMQQNHLSGQTKIYQTQVNGQKWYVLLYGNYHSVVAANAAIKQLPSNVQQPGLWVRLTP